jgi:16S rRNA (cytosine967-C5)-methyltransferase
VLGVLRWQGRLDWTIDHLSAKSTKIDPPVRTILRMGLFQLLQMNRVPVSAAVNTAVNLAKKHKRPWAAGFVNGLLRKAAAAADSVPWPDPAVDPVGYLAATRSFPRWLVQRWINRLGFTETDSLCNAYNTIPLHCIRTNTLRIERDGLIARLHAENVHARPTLFSPDGIDILSSKEPVLRTAAFEQGLFQIQDQAAQLVSHLTAPILGEKIWDACAGLGTKTAHMAQLMKNHGRLLASDVQTSKLDRLNAEMKRLGIRIVRTRTLNLQSDRLAPMGPDPGAFDRVLVDAPCSGTGAIQKNPDTKWRLKPGDFERYPARQLEILDRVAGHVMINGTLVYATCSIEPEENSRVIERFLQTHLNFAIQRPDMTAISDAQSLLTPEGWMATLPHRHGMEGFFAAVLKRHS